MKNLLLAVILFIFISVGCSTTKYVEVPIDRVKIEYRDKIQKDTFLQTDSVYFAIKGDTIFKEKYVYRYKTKEIHDTIVKIDTLTKVQVIYNTKEVNKLKDWQVILMILGGGLILVIGYKIFKKIKNILI